MKISVIMPSFLEHYEGAALFRQYKFYRAVDSFLNQTYADKELIIVSDGCKLTRQCYEGMYKQHPNIKLVRIDKQPLFSGKPRQEGILHAWGELICYLDTDDYFGPDHLQKIREGFYKEHDFVIFDDHLHLSDGQFERRNATIAFGHIGTSNVAHTKLLDIHWPNGVGHDFHAIRELTQKTKKYQKIEDCQYFVCHVPGQFDY